MGSAKNENTENASIALQQLNTATTTNSFPWTRFSLSLLDFIQHYCCQNNYKTNRSKILSFSLSLILDLYIFFISS